MKKINMLFFTAVLLLGVLGACSPEAEGYAPDPPTAGYPEETPQEGGTEIENGSVEDEGIAEDEEAENPNLTPEGQACIRLIEAQGGFDHTQSNLFDPSTGLMNFYDNADQALVAVFDCHTGEFTMSSQAVSVQPGLPVWEEGIHIVAAGETLWSIAQARGVTVFALQQANDLGTSTDIVVGQRLYLSGEGIEVFPIPYTTPFFQGYDLLTMDFAEADDEAARVFQLPGNDWGDRVRLKAHQSLTDLELVRSPLYGLNQNIVHDHDPIISLGLDLAEGEALIIENIVWIGGAAVDLAISFTDETGSRRHVAFVPNQAYPDQGGPLQLMEVLFE